jgi:predicted Zn-dependent protease
VRGGSVIPRVALIALALPVAAWLALSYHNAKLVADANAVVQQKKPPRPQVERALRELDRAGRLNPDRSLPQAVRVVLYLRVGRLDLARFDLEKLLRDEPENAEAWLLLASLSQESDPARAAQARARLRELSPPVAQR